MCSKNACQTRQSDGPLRIQVHALLSILVVVVIAFGLILSAFLVNRDRSKTEIEKPTTGLFGHPESARSAVHANLVEPGHSIFDKLVNGVPPMAPYGAE